MTTRAGARSSGRCGTAQTCVLVLDLDDLKSINDNAGHTEGDAALMSCGAVLQAVRRPGDSVARIGGD